MRKLLSLSLSLCLLFAAFPLSGNAATTDEVEIILSDSGTTVDGAAISTDPDVAVYEGADIVYYESGTDSSYGEGTEADMHTAEEAAAHTVVTITEPGTYRISGTLSSGQLAIDLGEDASSDSDAVVTLILDDMDITCTVAPAVIFYNVYECSEIITYGGGVVDTSDAGANVIIADGSTNNLNGSYVAKIYKEGTTSKLHKYDGALYSKMSMNVDGESLDTGIVNITADNEGLNSELHLTINGGNINITAENDGINTNEDYASVTTINGGTLYIVAGQGEEGDGIDSNGYLTINGGAITTFANDIAADGGIDADLDITVNGGTLMAFGTKNDSVSTDSDQLYMELSFSSKGAAGDAVELTTASGESLFSCTTAKGYQSVTLSSSVLQTDTVYHLTVNGVLQQYTGTGSSGVQGPGGERPEGKIPEGEMPEGEWTEGEFTGEPPAGGQQPGGNTEGTVGSPEFTLTDSIRSFSGISGYSGTSSFFSDVSNSSWYATAVEYVKEKGLFNGTSDTTFSPGSNMTRAMFVTVLWRLEGSPEADSSSFTDVSDSTYYADAVEWASANGIVEGYGNNLFKPSNSISRQEMATILYRYAEYKGTLTEADGTAFGAFTDSSSVASWATDAMIWCTDIGIINGTSSDTLLPSGTATRAQVAQIFMNYCEHFALFA